MARVAERYENHDWRLEPQEHFWKMLEQTALDVWGELNDLAQRWAKVAPGADFKGIKFGTYEDRFNSDIGADIYRRLGEKYNCEMAYIPGGGTLSEEMHEARRAWQDKYGLEVTWVEKRANLYILQKHTHISLSYITGYASVGPHPAPQPDDFSDGQLSEAWKREMFNPHWNLSRVQPTPTSRHLEWFIYYQCHRRTCRDIADHQFSEQAVEQAIKRVSDIIALPLRRQPKGRHKKIPNR